MSRSQCPNCGASRGLAEYSDGSYCHACQHKEFSKSMFRKTERRVNYIEPEEIYKNCQPVTDSQAAVDYLRNFYLTHTDLTKANCFQWHEGLQRIVYPVNAAACWGRSVDPNISPKSMFYGDKDKDCYLIENHEGPDDTLVIVEDILSCIRVSAFCSSLALCGTRVKNDLQALNILTFRNIILWLDGDVAGIKGAEKIKREYKLYKNVRVITTRKDPKEFAPEEIKEILG